MEYTVYATLREVQVYHIDANSPEEAREKVLSGEYDPFETLDSSIDNVEVEEGVF